MSIQNHLHIALTLGGTPEFAPEFQWKVVFPNYQEVPQVVLSNKRTSKGKLRSHTINNTRGVAKFLNYHITLKLNTNDTYTARQYLSFLEAMNGETVYFVDFDHPDDSSDHTSSIRAMNLLIELVKPLAPNLSYYTVDVSLFGSSVDVVIPSNVAATDVLELDSGNILVLDDSTFLEVSV